MSTIERGLVIGPDEGNLLTNPIGGRMIVKLRDADTSGGFSLFDNILPAESPGPRLHRHLRHDETFIVLDGELTVQLGDETVTAEPGSIVVIPRGMPHRPSNRSLNPTHVLLIFSPGGMDHFFEDAAANRIPMQIAPSNVDAGPNEVVKAFCEKFSFDFADSSSG
jgi:mannose-6-phosphate isomerase-like protein (cupin superfamily)